MKLLICTQAVDETHPILGFFVSWIVAFAKRFESVEVITLEEGQHQLPKNVRVRSLGKERGSSKVMQFVRFYWFFFWAIVRLRPRYVFFHMGAIYNVLSTPFFWVRKIWGGTFYWWKTHGQIDALGARALQVVDRVYTAAPESFPIVTPKRRVVGHAIDIDLFAPEEGVAKDIDVLFAGRFSRTKRIEQVIETTRRLVADGHDLRVVLVGEPVDQDYFEEIKTLIDTHQLSAVIKIMPAVQQDELVALYRRAVVFMNPSEHDGLDKVILEAMASGAIPLTGNLSFRELLGRHGLFVKKGDIAAFSRVIQKVMSMPTAERESLSQRLRDAVMSEHALSTLVDRIF